MSILGWRLAIDFGLVVLIWMVHLVIYPSFARFSKEELKKWHPTYRKQISFLVAPLLFIQTGLIAYQLVFVGSFYSISSAVFCSLCWILTFFEAIPLHRKIEQSVEVELSVQRLIAVRWKRTFAWTFIWLLTIGEILIQSSG